MWTYTYIAQDNVDTIFIPYFTEICIIATRFIEHVQYNCDLIKRYQDHVNSHSSFYQLEIRLIPIRTNRFDVVIVYQDGDGYWCFSEANFKYETSDHLTLDQIKF